jgi:hypothetical protein
MNYLKQVVNQEYESLVVQEKLVDLISKNNLFKDRDDDEQSMRKIGFLLVTLSK